MRHRLLPAVLLVTIAAILGATVFRAEIAGAAATLTVFVSNDATHPVPVHEQGTVTVSAPIETQVLVDRTFTGDERATIDVAAYKALHLDFTLAKGSCFGSGASLLAVEATRFLRRARSTPTRPARVASPARRSRCRAGR
jgi:hypothetical protein